MKVKSNSFWSDVEICCTKTRSHIQQQKEHQITVKRSHVYNGVRIICARSVMFSILYIFVMC